MRRGFERTIAAGILAGPLVGGAVAAQPSAVEVETSLVAETSPIGVRHGLDGVLGRFLPAERLGSRDREVRLEAARALGRHGPAAEAIPLLHDALSREGDRGVRLALLEALVRRASPDSVRVLAEVAASGLDAEEEWAFRGLSAIGSAEAAEPLVRCLPRARASRPCADALVELGPTATPVLLRALEADPRAVRAIEVLGRLRDETAVPSLVERAGAGESPLRAAAIEALGLVGGPRAREAVLAALEDGSQLVVGAAIVALPAVGRPADVERLEPFLDAYSPHLDAALASALRLDGARVAARLLSLLSSGDDRMRRAVASAAIASPAPALRAVLEQALAVDRVGALDALARLPEGAGLPTLLGLAERGADEDLAFALARAVRAAGGTEALPAGSARSLASAPPLARALARDPSSRAELVARLGAGEPIARADAARALALLGDSSVPLLDALERERDADAAAAILAAVVELGGRPSIALLLRLLDDPRTYVEAAPVLARRRDGLSAARSDALLRRLLAGLRARGADVRSASARALGTLGAEAPIPSLVAALGDEDPRVRLSVAHALAGLSDPRAREAVTTAARVETNPSLRRTLRTLATGAVEPLSDEAWRVLVLELAPAPTGAVRVVVTGPEGRLRTIVTRDARIVLPWPRGGTAFVTVEDEGRLP